jgi:FKBP-type peptidyl-prolyl cis-trans isomerase 2
VKSADALPAQNIITVQAGDIIDINYVCRLRTGEVAAASSICADSDKKSNIFVARKETSPVSIVAAEPDEPLMEKLRPAPFEKEILEMLARKTAGMKEGEKRQTELKAQMIPGRIEQEGFAQLARVRTREKEMKMPRGDYEFRAGKSPEIGQDFFYDPAFHGQVTEVTDEYVTIKFPNPGNKTETPFGPGRIREEGETYKVDIDAREGSLVRTGNKIGRISRVDDKVITIDYRHPFGYEELVCDVTVEQIRKAVAEERAAGKQ